MKLENFTNSAEKNKQPILNKIRLQLSGAESILEIGSGSGQHALYFAQELPHLIWQASETAEKIPALQKNLQEIQRPNLPAPLLLEVQSPSWPVASCQNIFSANTLHIMPWPAVCAMFSGIGKTLRPGGLLIIYGAMRYNGDFTSESNAKFDRWLKEQDPARGIRDFEAVDQLAQEQQLELLNDYLMPSSNQLLVWRRTAQ